MVVLYVAHEEFIGVTFNTCDICKCFVSCHKSQKTSEQGKEAHCFEFEYNGFQLSLSPNIILEGLSIFDAEGKISA